ncbi:epoxide hydrolase-like protein [Mycena galopus ATCC 62051]|nr:epoxide hydrolase-like protein [Mycena galopus ATCC 62051]
MSPFSTFPNPPGLEAKPFTVAIPDADVAELKSLLKASRLGSSAPTNSNPFDHSLGVSLDWLKTAKRTWETSFDWLAQEKRMNSFPQFMTKVPYIHDIHFMALFGKKKDAVPSSLIMLHGWPGPFIEFIPVLGILSEKYTPETLPYHVVVPSFPGYGFSSGPQWTEFIMVDVAKIVNDLMLGLEFDKYVAQGGDVGSGIARILTMNHDNSKAIHLNMFSTGPPENDDHSILSQAEREALDRGAVFRQTGWAYGIEQGTRPNTLGFALSSSPLALLAWFEEMREWSDENSSMDEILTNVSVYWFTSSISTSFYPCRESITRGPSYYKYHEKPVGYTWFPLEIIPPPESWVKKDCNLVFYRQAKSGGHFAVLEVPEVLLKDMQDFVAQVWGSNGNATANL